MTLTEILFKGIDVSAELNELKDLLDNGKITPKGYIKGLNRLMNRSEQYAHFLNEVEHYLNTLPPDTEMDSHQMVKGVLARMEEKRKRRMERKEAKRKDNTE